MAEDLYNIVFSGELVRSFDLPTVKKNVSQLFKVQGAKLDALFSGNAVVLKKNLNFETATKYRVAIKRAGARVDLQPVESEVKPVSPGKAVFDAPERESQAPASRGCQEADSAEVDDSSGLQLAPVGALVLAEAERAQVPAAELDLSSLSLKESGGNLVEDGEIPSPEPIDENSFELDLDQMGVAPAGEDLLRKDEKKKDVTVDLDLSELSIAEPGARLGAPSPKPPPAPDVSSISLEP